MAPCLVVLHTLAGSRTSTRRALAGIYDNGAIILRSREPLVSYISRSLGYHGSPDQKAPNQARVNLAASLPRLYRCRISVSGAPKGTRGRASAGVETHISSFQ